jgi:hypothetical protein
MPTYDETHDDGRATRRAIEAARLSEQQSWRDLQAKRAIEGGGHGRRPVTGAEHDPEWWAAQLDQRDRDAVLPPGLVRLREEADAMADAAEERQITPDVPRTEPTAQPRRRHWWNRR